MASKSKAGKEGGSSRTSPSISGSSVGSRLSPDEAGEILAHHNRARKAVGVRPLGWSGELAKYAQEWADHLKEDGCRLEHRPHSGRWRQEHGENLFAGTKGFYGGADAVKSWTDEKRLYKGGRLTSSNWYPSGHYTQVVWKGTEAVGCARSECGDTVVFVCNYDPAGNILGEAAY